MTSNDPITAALQELAAHHEQLTQLDARETDHHTTLSERLAELTDLITGIGHTLEGDAAVLARFEALDRQVADLAAQLTAHDAADGYHPDPAPAWWKLPAAERHEPIARIYAWVEQVYRPGYGHLAAATLAPCWPAHDLCLYGLDILSALWSVLYLQPSRNARLLSAQAEYQARILPALAEQMGAETATCGHRLGRAPAPDQSWSAS
jgi:hypothetical protein